MLWSNLKSSVSLYSWQKQTSYFKGKAPQKTNETKPKALSETSKDSCQAPTWWVHSKWIRDTRFRFPSQSPKRETGRRGFQRAPGCASPTPPAEREIRVSKSPSDILPLGSTHISHLNVSCPREYMPSRGPDKKPDSKHSTPNPLFGYCLILHLYSIHF